MRKGLTESLGGVESPRAEEVGSDEVASRTTQVEAGRGGRGGAGRCWRHSLRALYGSQRRGRGGPGRAGALGEREHRAAAPGAWRHSGDHARGPAGHVLPLPGHKGARTEDLQEGGCRGRHGEFGRLRRRDDGRGSARGRAAGASGGVRRRPGYPAFRGARPSQSVALQRHDARQAAPEGRQHSLR